MRCMSEYFQSQSISLLLFLSLSLSLFSNSLFSVGETSSIRRRRDCKHTHTDEHSAGSGFYSAPLTCQGFDARALEQACWAVLIVPVVGVPAVVDAIVELLLDLHVFKLRCHRRHLDLFSATSESSQLMALGISRPRRKNNLQRKIGNASYCVW